MFQEKKLLQVILCGLAILSANIALGSGVPNKEKAVYDKNMAFEMKTLVNINKRVLQFKQESYMTPKTVSNIYFTSAAWIKWNRMKSQSGFSPLFWSDFFTGCLIFNGSFSDNNAAVSLYNPWWDAILSLRMAKNTKDEWVISSFIFQSGEDFRQEKVSDPPSIDSVLPKEGRLGMIWMYLIKRTRESFNKKFSNMESFVWSNDFPSSSHLPVQLRASARIQLLREIMNNQGVMVEVLAYAKLLKNANVNDIKRVFTNKDEQKIFALWAAMGKFFRKDITSYGSVVTEKNRLHIYVNAVNPRFVCLVYVNVGKERNFEWFDLDDSERFIKTAESMEKRR